LDLAGNKCRIYDFRPFECQLYPFLITQRGKKIILTVDLNCPYVKENVHTHEFKAYTEYLGAFLNSPAQISLLQDNPQLLQAYKDVLDVLELKA
jgi:Fe-S-cluster containining protein